MTNSKLYSIYGAKYSKDGKRVNITLIAGENESKEYANVSIKLEGKGKTQVKIKDQFAWVKIPLLKDLEKKEKKETKTKKTIKDEDIPF